jgi:HSP20 family protein
MKLARYPTLPSLTWSPFEGIFRYPFAGTAFDSFFTQGAPAHDSPAAGLAVDVYEDAANYYARFEVPGVKKEDAQIELEDRRLKVSVTRKSPSGDQPAQSELSRLLTIPKGIAVDGITAKLEDGLLTLTLPKQEERKPRVIALN